MTPLPPDQYPDSVIATGLPIASVRERFAEIIFGIVVSTGLEIFMLAEIPGGDVLAVDASEHGM
jgi:hypothetical protein